MDKSTQTVTGEGNAPRYDLSKWANDERNHHPKTRAAVRELLAQRDELLALVKRAYVGEVTHVWEADAKAAIAKAEGRAQ